MIHRRMITTMLFFLPIVLPVFAQSNFVSVPADPASNRLITVTGTSVTPIDADIMVWTITSTDRNRELGAAKANNDRKIEGVLEHVKQLDVKPEDVQSGSLSVNKRYQEDRNRASYNPLEIWYYEVVRSVSVRVDGLERFDEFLESLIALEDVEAQFQLDSSKILEARFDNRLEAVRMAKKKAEAMLNELGAELGPVRTVREQAQNDYMPMQTQAFNNVVAYDGGGGDAAGTLSPGTIEVKTTVEVVFEIL